MECEAVCVVRKLSYLFTYGLDVTGDIITQGVRRCTLHFAMLSSLYQIIYRLCNRTASAALFDNRRWTHGTMCVTLPQRIGTMDCHLAASPRE